MTCIKTLKSKCIIVERLIVESQDLRFADLGLLVRIIAFEKEKLNLKDFSHKYNVTEGYLSSMIEDLKQKGYIISLEKENG